MLDMLMEFVSMQFSREELKELHAALLTRAILTNVRRHEGGEESIERHPLLEKIEALLGADEDSLHHLDHSVDEELWEYAWYVFTDEWALFRAMQDARKHVGKSRKASAAIDLENLADQFYQHRFEEYVSEISMMETKTIRPTRSQEKSHDSHSPSG